MAQSHQAKEVVLEIGDEIGLQEFHVQVQNGTITRDIFDRCEIYLILLPLKFVFVSLKIYLFVIWLTYHNSMYMKYLPYIC